MSTSPDVIHAALASTGLSQVALAEALGVHPPTLRRWLAESRAMPEPARRLCGLLARDPLLLLALE